jgi:hypothetical protein
MLTRGGGKRTCGALNSAKAGSDAPKHEAARMTPESVNPSPINLLVLFRMAGPLLAATDGAWSEAPLR